MYHSQLFNKDELITRIQKRKMTIFTDPFLFCSSHLSLRGRLSTLTFIHDLYHLGEAFDTFINIIVIILLLFGNSDRGDLTRHGMRHVTRADKSGTQLLDTLAGLLSGYECLATSFRKEICRGTFKRTPFLSHMHNRIIKLR